MAKNDTPEFDIEKMGNGYDPFADMLSKNLPDSKNNEEEEEDDDSSDEKANKEKLRLEKERKDKEEKEKNKNSKEDNIKALRDKKDKLEREVNEYKEKVNSLEEFTSFKEVRDYLKQKTGKDKITEEEVRAYIAKNKARKEKLTELEKALAEKESKIKEMDIERSSEWQEVYVKNINQSISDLKVTITNYDADEKVRAPELTDKFFRSITTPNQDGTIKNAQQIKAILSSFKKEFYDSTGIEYEAPSIPELVKAVEAPHAAIRKASEARKNWDASQDQIRKERTYQQVQERKRNIEIEKTNRQLIIEDYLRTDEANTLRAEFGQEFDTYVKEEHDFLNTTLEDPSQGKRGYGSLASSLAKAKLVDAALTKIKTQEAQIKALQKQIEKGRPPKGAGVKHEDADPDDKPAFDISKMGNGYDPTKDLE